MKHFFPLVIAGIIFLSCAAAPKTSEKNYVSSAPLAKETTTNVMPDTPEARPASPVTADDKKGAAAKDKAESETAKTDAVKPAPAEKIRGSEADTDKVMEEVRTGAPAKSPAAGKTETLTRTAPAESGLKAGYSDDNDQFNYFVKFLDQYKGDVVSYPLNIGERIILAVSDSAGKPVSNADVTVRVKGKTVSGGRTYASGIFHLFPLEYPDTQSYQIQVAYGAERKELTVDRKGPRTVAVSLAGARKALKEVPLDILFILDTTGSMGEEIERLRSTIEIINENVSAVTPKPRVRFGMVLYRDVDDEYQTQDVPFTSDLAGFQKTLDGIAADGGGDQPEDLQTALSDAINEMDWNKDGIRLAFTITDAEPHLDYGQTFTYAEAAREAKAKGIKLFTVGSGGLPLQGEYVLRQISQFTDARYIFLTYGEQGESEGGTEASVSHHTGSNFQTDKLETIIIRFTREELAYLSDKPLVVDDPYFDAKKIGSEDRDATLSKLFQESLQNLVDYSTFAVGPATRAVILPVALSEADGTSELRRQAEYFSESLLLATVQKKPFVIVERKDLQKILDEQKLQYSGAVEDDTAVRLGALLGAEVMVTGRLYIRNDKYEIFLKLLRVETGEILSVSRAKLTKDLGL